MLISLCNTFTVTTFVLSLSDTLLSPSVFFNDFSMVALQVPQTAEVLISTAYAVALGYAFLGIIPIKKMRLLA